MTKGERAAKTHELQHQYMFMLDYPQLEALVHYATVALNSGALGEPSNQQAAGLLAEITQHMAIADQTIDNFITAQSIESKAGNDPLRN
jgi:hypothetical protein